MQENRQKSATPSALYTRDNYKVLLVQGRQQSNSVLQQPQTCYMFSALTDTHMAAQC